MRIKNRTHWEENNQTVIEWDGTTEGRETAEFISQTWYKISDATPTHDEVVGGILSAQGTEAELTEEILSDTWGSLQGDNHLFLSVAVVAYNTDFSIMETSCSVPSTGIWVTTAFEKLSYGSTTVHKLDPKFLPESVATTSYVDEKVSAAIPAYTEEDYGKFLTPSADGLVWYSMPDAEEASF